MRKPPPPLRPLAVSIVVDGLRLYVPVAALAVLVLAATPGLLSILSTQAQAPASELEQRWTAGPGVASMAVEVVRGALPSPDPRQRKAPCDPDVEHELNGYCWVPIAVWPCPKGKTWEHAGKCYQRALRVEKLPRDPTSGEGRSLGLADP
jgi:hypothetical protein